MKTRFVWLASWLLAVCLLSLMVGCDKQEQSVTAPVEAAQIDQSDSPALDEQGEKANPTTADKAWWRGLSQGARNQAIIERALQDNNRYVGQNCKIWARTVVLAASRNVVYLPSTLPNENGWYFASSPYLVGMSGGIRSAQPGWIVQTNWKLKVANTSPPQYTITPHTFIVLSRTASGVNIIECNWTPWTVKTRFVPFTDFEGADRKVVLYSCYYAIGG